MNELITFSTRTEFCFTFTEFFEIYFDNDSKKQNYARRLWDKMIERMGGTECEFSDEVGFSDFKTVIDSIKIDAESDICETDSEDEEANKTPKSEKHDSDSD